MKPEKTMGSRVKAGGKKENESGKVGPIYSRRKGGRSIRLLSWCATKGQQQLTQKGAKRVEQRHPA